MPSAQGESCLNARLELTWVGAGVDPVLCIVEVGANVMTDG